MTLKKRLPALLAACLLLFTGCSEQQDDDRLNVTVPQDYPVQIGDVQIDACPKKVVSLSPALTEIVYTLGSSSQLCGVSNLCDYPDIPDDMERMGTIYEPNTNLIIARNADVVLTTANLSQEYLIKLQNAKIPVAVIPAANDFARLEEVYSLVAKVMAGNFAGAANAENTFANLKNSLSAVKGKSTGRTAPSAVLILALDEAVATGDTLAGDLLLCSGASNAAQDATGYAFSKEQLLAADPDYIFCSDADKRRLESSADYQSLTAVKSQKVCAVDISCIEREGDRMIETVRQMAAFLFPDLWESVSATTTESSR